MLTIRFLHLISILTGPFDWMTMKTEPTGIWEKLITIVEQFGHNVFRLLTAVGVVTAVGCFATGCIMIFFWQRIRESGKEKMVLSLFGILLVLATPFIVKAIGQFAEELNNNVEESNEPATEGQTIHEKSELWVLDVGDDYAVVNIS